MRASASWLVVTVVLTSLSGWGSSACYSPEYQNGGLRCNNRLCPEGYVCVAPSNTCWKEGTAPPTPDGGTSDDVGGGGDVPPDINGPVDMREPDDGGDPDAEDETGSPTDPVARLQSLAFSPGMLEPPFAPGTLRYDLNLPLFTPSVNVEAVAESNLAMLALNDSSISTATLMAPFRLSPGPSRANVRVSARGFRPSVYGVSINTGGVYTYLKGASTQVNMAFGTAMAMAGNTLVIGAPNDHGTLVGPQIGDSGPMGMESGAAFVFRREGGQWRREVTLKPGHLHPMMRFGASVAVAGDVVIVGAPGENGSTTMINGPRDTRAAGAGAAFVFVRGADGAWTQQAYLKASDGEAQDRFGTSVALSISGTANNTVTTAVVGAPVADGPNDAARAGAVYVFVRSPAGAWSEQARPRPATLRAAQEFGSSVSLLGDTLVVGSPLEDSGAGGINPGATPAVASDSGAVYVFSRAGTAWSQSTYIKAPSAAAQARFGARIAIAGTFLAVGAPGDSGGGGGVSPSPGAPAVAGSGAAFLYRRATNGWELAHQIKATVARPQDRFGESIALSAASPTPTLVVGAPFDDTNEAGAYDPSTGSPTLDSGAIFVYRPAADGRWSAFAKLKAPNAERFDAFGASVAVEGDAVVAGADREASAAIDVGGTMADNGAPGSGAAYVF
ncbi:MAG TPA: FG-GAP repeat protein [Polyangia bacterium]